MKGTRETRVEGTNPEDVSKVSQQLVAKDRPDEARPVSWPWFVVGCVLLTAALVAFFWAFALGELKPSQHFLLMWILPLSSGFACGCFAGSLRVSGPLASLAIAATGGFAVWLLTYFLLPQLVTLPPDSVSVTFEPGTTFRQAARQIAEKDGYNIVFRRCFDDFLDAEIRPERMTAKGPQQLLEKLQFHLVRQLWHPTYRVHRMSEQGTFEFDCQ